MTGQTRNLNVCPQTLLGIKNKICFDTAVTPIRWMAYIKKLVGAKATNASAKYLFLFVTQIAA